MINQFSRASASSPPLFSNLQIDREVVASHLTTKDTKSTKESENETLDANFQFCHVEVH